MSENKILIFYEEYLKEFTEAEYYSANFLHILKEIFKNIDVFLHLKGFKKDFKITTSNFSQYFFFKIIKYNETENDEKFCEFDLRIFMNDQTNFVKKFFDGSFPKQTTIKICEIYERRELFNTTQDLCVKNKFIYIPDVDMNPTFMVAFLDWGSNLNENFQPKLREHTQYPLSLSRTIKIEPFWPTQYTELLIKNMAKIRIGGKPIELKLENSANCSAPFLTVLKKAENNNFNRTLVHLNYYENWKTFKNEDLLDVRMNFLEKKSNLRYQIDQIVWNKVLGINNTLVEGQRPEKGIEMNNIIIEHLNEFLGAIQNKEKIKQVVDKINILSNGRNNCKKYSVDSNADTIENDLEDLNRKNKILSDFFDKKQVVLLELKYYQLNQDFKSGPKPFLLNLYQTGYQTGHETVSEFV